MSRRDGFTLFEMCLVIAIVLLLAGLAVPSMTSFFAEQRLDKTFDRFDDFVRRTQLRAVQERRAMVMIWDGEGITVQPDEPTEEDTAGDKDYLDFSEGTYGLERPAALEKKPAVEWLFWRSGTCEPAIVHFEGGHGKWTARYDALTTRAEIIDKEVQ